MPEHSNDRLESFFKKVSGRPDISFNEADWKKLEAKLDANATRSSVARRNRNRIAGSTVVGILLIGGLYWLSQSETELAHTVTAENIDTPTANSVTEIPKVTPSPSQIDMATERKDSETTDVSSKVSEMPQKRNVDHKVRETGASSNISGVTNHRANEQEEIVAQSSALEKSDHTNDATQINIDEQTPGAPGSITPIVIGGASAPTIATQIDKSNDIIDTKISPAIADKTKQKAGLADSVVREKNDVKVKDAYGSGLTEHPSPRLSLLLSIAPDFSTVAFDYYTDPGRAIGLTLHYHVKRSWSFSTGAVLSHKKYVGDGEDYKPPVGYWKNHTNGIIPETIDGACNVLEIPLMVQYAILNKGKNRVLVGAGASSYIMLDESYAYNFEYPNPSAKQGWSTQNESALFFNVINVTAGFEHRISPGFMIGIEPYLKIPLEGIGWSDMKLYSAGASVTVRYIILNQKNPSAF